MEEEQPKVTRRRGRRRKVGLWMLLSVAFVVVLLGLATLGLTGRPIELPGWVTERAEARVNKALGAGRVSLGGIELLVDRGGRPRVALRNVGVYDDSGAELGRLNEVRARFRARPLLDGRIEPQSLQLAGAQITLRRRANGEFDLSFGGGMGRSGTVGSFLEGFDAVFATAPLESIRRLEASELTITLEDARSGRVWQVTDGSMTLENGADSVDATLAFDVFNGTEELARTVIGFRSPKGSAAATLSATFQNAAAADIAAQSPVLSFLSVIDAPISGALRVGMGGDGTLDSFDGTLEIGAGALQPTDATLPIDFQRGRAYFSYDPRRQRIDFSEVSAKTEAAQATASGHAYLRDFRQGWPLSLIGQFQISDVVVRPEGMLAEPARFSSGAMDMKIELDPFRATIGQLVMVEGAERFRASGTAIAGADGWETGLDIELNAIGHDRLLSLWPVALAPRTRDWLIENVQTGLLFDVNGAVRFKPGEAPVLSLGYEFEQGNVQVMKTLPPIEGGRGYAKLEGTRYTMVVEEGTIASPQGGTVDMAGSVMVVPDITRKPSRMELALAAAGEIPAALSVLDLPPFRIMERAKRSVDIAQGQAAVSARVEFDLGKRIRASDVAYTVSGVLTDVSSDRLMDGRLLTSDELTLEASPEQVSIGGRGELDGVPFDAAWTQSLTPGTPEPGRVEGQIELSQRFIDAFGIGLPPGTVSGQGQGDISIALEPEAPSFELTSDLRGIGLSLPDLGWSMGRDASGELTVAGVLGARPRIDTLDISGPGLSASGTVDLVEGGGLATAAFDRVQIGGWLNAPVILRGRGQGAPPAVEVSGGSIDIRGVALGQGGGGAGRPIDLALDRLTISEGIVLTGFRGDLQSGQGGMSGNFTARVDGGAAIAGQLVPQQGGTAVRIRSDDAGRAASDAGVLRNLRGGALDLSLVPMGPEGAYRGSARVTDTRIRNAPAMAELLSAVSVVGLIEQLNGNGIMLSEVEAEFELTPRAIRLLRSSGVGPSLGISLDGVYDLGNKRMNMQGVVSPVYFLNSIGSIFTRRGEGLFGFNFQLTGPASDPDVQVNPLSILTPGMFREIFRRPPPQPSGSAPSQ